MTEPEIIFDPPPSSARRIGWIVWAFFCLSVPAFYFIGWRALYVDILLPEGHAQPVTLLHQVAAVAAGLVGGLRFLRWRRETSSARLIHMIIAAPFATVVVLMGYLEKSVYNPVSPDAIYLFWAGAVLHLINMPWDL